jgi:serine/threonine-protein kinase
MTDGKENKTIGEYKLIEKIGVGAQGVVYKAKALSPQNTKVKAGSIVAIKVLKDGLKQDEPALLNLHHKNIIRYYDSFDDFTGYYNVTCLVMELLEGNTLDKLLEMPDNQGGFEWRTAKNIIDQCLDGLIFASKNGIVHRDIKPSNIFVTYDGEVKLIDFEIAKSEQKGQTSTVGWRGSFDYMSPDFANRHKDKSFVGDEQSDVFSFAVCMYEMLTGCLPFASFGDNADLEYSDRWKGKQYTNRISFSRGYLAIMDASTKVMISKGLSIKREDRIKSFESIKNTLGKCNPLILKGRDNSYELMKYIGRGSYGSVWQGRNMSTGDIVAIKQLILSNEQNDNVAVERFQKEAAIMEKLNHKNIVKFIDFIEVDSLFTDHFIVMEYLEGMPEKSLARQIDKFEDNGITYLNVIDIFLEFAEALSALHQENIIHRDIKTANFYVDLEQLDNVKLFDFGVVRTMRGTRTSGNVPGTLDYMAPEFAKSPKERGSSKTDIYAFGLCFYNAVTGSRVFPELPSSPQDAMVEFSKRVKGEVTQQIDYTLPIFKDVEGLLAIISKCIAMNPKYRYSSVKDIIKALTRLKKEFSDTLNVPFSKKHNKGVLPGETGLYDFDLPSNIQKVLDYSPGDTEKDKVNRFFEKFANEFSDTERPEEDLSIKVPSFVWLIPTFAALILVLIVAFFMGQRFVQDHYEESSKVDYERGYLRELNSNMEYVNIAKKVEFWGVSWKTKYNDLVLNATNYQHTFNSYIETVDKENNDEMNSLKGAWEEVGDYLTLVNMESNHYEYLSGVYQTNYFYKVNRMDVFKDISFEPNFEMDDITEFNDIAEFYSKLVGNPTDSEIQSFNEKLAKFEKIVTGEVLNLSFSEYDERKLDLQKIKNNLSQDFVDLHKKIKKLLESPSIDPDPDPDPNPDLRRAETMCTEVLKGEYSCSHRMGRLIDYQQFKDEDFYILLRENVFNELKGYINVDDLDKYEDIMGRKDSKEKKYKEKYAVFTNEEQRKLRNLLNRIAYLEVTNNEDSPEVTVVCTTNGKRFTVPKKGGHARSLLDVGDSSDETFVYEYYAEGCHTNDLRDVTVSGGGEVSRKLEKLIRFETEPTVQQLVTTTIIVKSEPERFKNVNVYYKGEDDYSFQRLKVISKLNIGELYKFKVTSSNYEEKEFEQLVEKNSTLDIKWDTFVPNPVPIDPDKTTTITSSNPPKRFGKVTIDYRKENGNSFTTLSESSKFNIGEFYGFRVTSDNYKTKIIPEKVSENFVFSPDWDTFVLKSPPPIPLTRDDKAKINDLVGWYYELYHPSQDLDTNNTRMEHGGFPTSFNLSVNNAEAQQWRKIYEILKKNPKKPNSKDLKKCADNIDDKDIKYLASMICLCTGGTPFVNTVPFGGLADKHSSRFKYYSGRGGFVRAKNSDSLQFPQVDIPSRTDCISALYLTENIINHLADPQIIDSKEVIPISSSEKINYDTNIEQLASFLAKTRDSQYVQNEVVRFFKDNDNSIDYTNIRYLMWKDKSLQRASIVQEVNKQLGDPKLTNNSNFKKKVDKLTNFKED